MDSDDQAAFLRALGKRVRLLRLMKDLTQEELGRQAGVSPSSPSFISLIEKGTRGIEVVRLLRLAAVLGFRRHT